MRDRIGQESGCLEDISTEPAPRNPPEISDTRLAIAIVTRNRRDSLLQTIEHLRDLETDYPIILVDNNSTDGTIDIVTEQFPSVRVIKRTGNIGSVARGFGIQAAGEPYIAFADDDSWWAKGALSQAVQLFDQHPRLGLIMSRVLVGTDQRLDACCQIMEHSPLSNRLDLPGIPILGFVSCGAVIRRVAFLSVGGFHERFGTGGEEELLAIDLAENGWGLSYIDRIVSYHYPSNLRDNKRRHIDEVRDALWVSWLRRSVHCALRHTLRYVRSAYADSETFLGLMEALRGLPWILRQRCQISADLEKQLKLLD